MNYLEDDTRKPFKIKSIENEQLVEQNENKTRSKTMHKIMRNALIGHQKNEEDMGILRLTRT